MENYSKAMDLALRYLGYRMRSRKEMEDYLLGKEFSAQTIETVLVRLNEYGYVNDDEFAQRYAVSRGKRGGPYKIKMELRQKGIDDDAIAQALEQINPDEHREGAIRFAKRALREENDAKARQRAYMALARRGYDGGLIRSVIAELMEGDGGEDGEDEA